MDAMWSSRARSTRSAFSLVELVMVVAIMAIIGAIAVPRMQGRIERAKAATLVNDLRQCQEAIERYRAEHGGRTPAHAANGTVDSDGSRFAARLAGRTQETGAVDASGLFGPYLRAMPVHPLTRLNTVRINGAAAGAGTHGWRFDVARGILEPDHVRGGSIDDLVRETHVEETLTEAAVGGLSLDVGG